MSPGTRSARGRWPPNFRRPPSPVEESAHSAQCRLANPAETSSNRHHGCGRHRTGGSLPPPYARLDLTLAPYDARAHLVVARRILDSLTPGWQQIGAVCAFAARPQHAARAGGRWYRTARRGSRSRCCRWRSQPDRVSWLLLRTTGSIVASIRAPRCSCSSQRAHLQPRR